MDYSDVLSLLNELHPETDFAAETDFIGRKLLTSFDIMMLAAALDEQYGILLDAADIVPENFASAGALLKLIQSKEDM